MKQVTSSGSSRSSASAAGPENSQQKYSEWSSSPDYHRLPLNAIEVNTSQFEYLQGANAQPGLGPGTSSAAAKRNAGPTLTMAASKRIATTEADSFQDVVDLVQDEVREQVNSDRRRSARLAKQPQRPPMVVPTYDFGMPSDPDYSQGTQYERISAPVGPQVVAQAQASPNVEPIKREVRKVKVDPNVAEMRRQKAQEEMASLKTILKDFQTSMEGFAPSNVPADGVSAAEPINERKAEPPVFLTEEQKKVLDMVVDQQMSVFFTGAAGTGKSVLLRRIIQDLRARYENGVAVTASTGIAACNIGGTTLHSWAGIGLGKGPANELAKKIKKSLKFKRRWLGIKVLIIDEVSMINGDLLTKLEQVARIVRGKDVPFGGIQVVLTGDFFQLPPVEKRQLDNFGEGRDYAFRAPCWKKVIPNTILLTQVFRQKDSRFANILNQMRTGKLDPMALDLFKSLTRTPKMPDDISPTRLFSRRDEVERANNRALSALEGKICEYRSEDWFKNEDARRLVNLDHLIAPELVTLKVGAQVMMIRNIDETLVNGSLGRVIGFMSQEVYAHGISGHLPDILAADFDDDDVAGEFHGKLLGLPDDRDIASMETANARRKRLRLDQLKRALKASELLPLVRFYSPDGTFRDLLVQPEIWKFEDADGAVLASRTQMPLILAWALSIHKSQGQTLDWLSVDLRSVFEAGQAYVAISRATSIEGLQVHNFSASKVFVDQAVTDFYNSLGGVSDLETAVSESDFQSISQGVVVSQQMPSQPFASQQSPPAPYTTQTHPPIHEITPTAQQLAGEEEAASLTSVQPDDFYDSDFDSLEYRFNTDNPRFP